MIITPAILTDNFDEFSKQIKRLEEIFNYVQIDIMDEKFVPGKSFPDIEKINKIKTKLDLELHFMTEDPLAEMQKWLEIKRVFRVVFHIEAKSDIKKCIHYARGKCWQVGLALNPETPLDKVKPYLKHINLVQFMTVNPGKQGQIFKEEVKKKIKKFLKIKKHPLCSVDGGVNFQNIKSLATLGVDIANVGSALIKSKNLLKTYNDLVCEMSCE